LRESRKEKTNGKVKEREYERMSRKMARLEKKPSITLNSKKTGNIKAAHNLVEDTKLQPNIVKGLEKVEKYKINLLGKSARKKSERDKQKPMSRQKSIHSKLNPLCEDTLYSAETCVYVS
jgi:hypothetical protein